MRKFEVKVLSPGGTTNRWAVDEVIECDTVEYLRSSTVFFRKEDKNVISYATIVVLQVPNALSVIREIVD